MKTKFCENSNYEVRFHRRFYTGSLILLPIISIGVSCCAQNFFTSGEDSWRPNGLFCFKSGTDKNTQIHLVRYKDGKLETVFTKDASETIQAPICLDKNVITVSPDGVIRKLDLNGEVVFRKKPIDFKGASGWSGRISDKHVFMTETLWNDQKKDWVHYLYIVNISGKEPVVATKFNIIQPFTVTLTSDEIVIVGVKDVQRLKLPDGLE